MPLLSLWAARLVVFLALGPLSVFVPTAPASAAVPAEGVVVGAGAPDAIPGRYIVVLKAGLGASAQGLVGAGLVGAAQVSRTFGGLSAFSARISARQARRLAADPSVSFVEQDRTVRIETTTQRKPSWGLDRIDQRSRTRSGTYTPTDDGSSVHAYVIDTGIRISHVEFGGRASYGADFVNGTNRDCHGHGTHVAGTVGGAIYGVAKKVKLIAVRVLDCEGSGSLEGVVDGVNWVTQHAIKPAVANMSLGSSNSNVLDYAVAQSIKSGVTYAVAAGNENQDAKYSSPADVSTAITVGATNAGDRRAGFSNYGADVDLFAPGVDVWSAYSRSDYTIAMMSGTSMASPHVAGAAALVLDAHPNWSPRFVRDYLVRTATTGKVTHRGAKSPNRLLFVTAPPPAPMIKTKSVAAATVGVAYRSQLALTAARRGTWRVTGGTLPAGLTLSASGLLAGTPTTPTTSHITVGFTDYVPTTAKRALTVTVRATKPSINTTTLPDGTANSGYAAQLTVADGRSGTWSLAGGTLPAGLALSSTGALTGTPLAAGSYSVTVRFTDTWSQSVLRTLPLTVASGAPESLPDGVTGVSYDATLPAAADLTGGTWSVAGGGVLPDGLALSTAGQITGVPTVAGAVVVRFTYDGTVDRSADYLITVN